MSQAAVSVTDSATLILAENFARAGAKIYNNATKVIYWGTDSDLTTATGIPLYGDSSLVFDSLGPLMSAFYKGDIYGIVASGTADVRVVEFVTTR